jgi:hypothetical protein
MAGRDDKWQVFDLYNANFQSVSRAQDFYVRLLFLFLALIWSWEILGSNGEVKIQVLGTEIHVTSLWLATPLAITVITLALIGAMNAQGPIWRRLRKAIKELELDFYFTDIDTHKNLLDYFGFLTLRPEKRIQETVASQFKYKRFTRFSVFIYPSLIAAGTYTTAMSRMRLPEDSFLEFYIWGCVVVQLAFSLRVYWRALCGLLLMRTKENELI